MRTRNLPARTPTSLTRLATPALAALSLLAAPTAHAAEGDPQDEAPAVAGTGAEAAPTATPTPTAPTTTTTTTVTTGATAEAPASPAKFGASASIETSIGLGTFVSGDQSNAAVSTSLSGSAYYTLAEYLKLNASLSLTWFQVLDIDTTLGDNDVLLSDIIIGVSHGRIYHHDDSGFNLAGAIRVGLPTSLASQFQNRLFSLSTGLTASIPVGPVSFTYAFTFGKYFNLTAVPTLDCEDFDDPTECIEGRDNNPNFGFESERRGPEVYLRGSGASSYYFRNALTVNWTIVEGLDLSLDFSISNSFGVRSFARDEFSNEHAVEGRAQSDRLLSGISLSYQFIKQLSAAISLVTDTSQPFGAQGDDFPVIFDFTRAPDNITSLNVSVTGSF